MSAGGGRDLGPAPSGGASHVAVFGSSEPLPGDALYALARELGAELARSGAVVVTGGYGGVMEAACRGAREAGGRTVGVICEIFAERSPCAYLDERVATRDLYDRTRELIERSHAFVVLDGKAGTLAELAFLWALERAGCLAARRVVLLGEGWLPLLAELERGGRLDPNQLALTTVTASPAEAVRALWSPAAPERRG